MSMGRPRRSPRVFVSYAHDSLKHKDLVLRFARLLQGVGVDVHIDMWYTDQRRDWYTWLIDQVNQADYVITVASPQYKTAGEGTVPDTQNRGVQSEAALLRELLHDKRQAWTRKLLPVVLPGRLVDEIPLFLSPRSATHYLVPELTHAGVNELLEVLQGPPRHILPSLGTEPWPVAENDEPGSSVPSVGRVSIATPGSLLRAEAETVAFCGRSNDLDDLASWRDGPEPFAIRLITGEAGQGKTRLGFEFLRSCNSAGWSGDWLHASSNPWGQDDGVDQELLYWLRQGTKPILVVADYAESIPESVATVITAMRQRSGSKARLLLLSRTDGSWWANFRDWLESPGRPILTHTALNPLATSVTVRKEVFTYAVQALATGLSTLSRQPGSALAPGIDWVELSDTISAPDLRHDRYGNALTLQTTALTTLLAAAEGESPSTLDPDEELVRHEQTYLSRVAARRGLNSPGVLSANPDPDSRIRESISARNRALAALILLDPCDRQTVRPLAALACADTTIDNARYVADWLAALYPPGSGADAPVGRPQPDRLAEAMLRRILEQQPDLLDDVVPLVTDFATARYMLAVLVRAADTAVGRTNVASRIIELITVHPTPFATVAAWVAATVGHGVEPLLQGLCMLADNDGKQFNGQAQVAGSLLAQQPQIQAPFIAAGIGFLVTLYRRLVATKPDDHYHKAGLASSPNSYSVLLAETRQYTEAVSISQQAVKIYQELVIDHRDTHLPDLALALANYAVRLTETGQHGQAIDVSRQALAICEELIERDRGAYLNYLALAMNNHVHALSLAGNPYGALELSRRVIDTCRELVDNKGDDHLPHLAQAQTSYAALLYSTGQFDLATSASEHAVDTWRKLVDLNRLTEVHRGADLPGYLPTLVEALATHVALLTEVGRHDDALQASLQALQASSVLITHTGEAYLATRAQVLGNHAVVLAKTSDMSQAVQFSRQAVKIYTKLADANRATYLPRLAQSMANYFARLYEAGQHDEALRISRQTLDIYQDLVDHNRDAHLPGLALALNNYATCLADAGRLDQAKHTCSQAIVVFRELADTRSFLTQDYIQCLVNLGRIHIQSKKFHDAIEPLRTALAKSNELSELDNADIADLLRMVEQGDPSDAEGGLK